MFNHPENFMRALKPAFAALLLSALPVAFISASPAAAQAAPAADPAASQFIESLANDAFAVLRDESLSKADARTKFRKLLQESVALRSIGQRLIRKHRDAVTPAQMDAYNAAFPEFILNAYADRLYDYQDASIKVVRANPRGPFTDVQTRVQRPGRQPVDAIWQVRKTPQGRYQVNNLTVSNINLSITQEADFNAYIQKNGFDALVSFLKSANTKSANAR
jgi:phospholipid transport system substrate-binding protein